MLVDIFRKDRQVKVALTGEKRNIVRKIYRAIYLTRLGKKIAEQRKREREIFMS